MEKDKTQVSADADIDDLTFVDCGWGGSYAPPCPRCPTNGEDYADATLECGHLPWPHVATDGRNWFAAIRTSEGQDTCSVRFPTRDEAAKAARERAAQLIALMAAKAMLADLYEIRHVELTAPIRGLPMGITREDPVKILRMALEQGLCKDPEQAAEVLALAASRKGSHAGDA